MYPDKPARVSSRAGKGQIDDKIHGAARAYHHRKISPRFNSILAGDHRDIQWNQHLKLISIRKWSVRLLDIHMSPKESTKSNR